MRAEKVRHFIDGLLEVAFEGISSGVYCHFKTQSILEAHYSASTKELVELERIATEYESNKHYIELGKAVEKAFNKNCDIYLYEENESVNGYLLGYGVEVAERITKPEQLLEWAEGRE